MDVCNLFANLINFRLGTISYIGETIPIDTHCRLTRRGMFDRFATNYARWVLEVAIAEHQNSDVGNIWQSPNFGQSIQICGVPVLLLCLNMGLWRTKVSLQRSIYAPPNPSTLVVIFELPP